MKNELIKKILAQSNSKQRLYAAGILLFIIAYFLYGIMLAPYISGFLSLRHKLGAETRLLKLKISRASDINSMGKERAENEKTLRDINKRFFTEREADDFIKNLVKVAAGYGNQVSELQPKAEERQLSRSEELKKMAASLPAPNAIMDFISGNVARIDSDSEEMDLLNKAVAMLPEPRREQFKAIWQKERSGLLFKSKLQKTDLTINLYGSYKGIISLLDWFANYDKLVEMTRLGISAGQENVSGLEAVFCLTIYVRSE